MSNQTICLHNVTQIYRVKFNFPHRTEEKDIVALKDINFAVEKGESVAILGPNGSGKTTLLKIIAGLLSPDKGEVKVDGKIRGIFELGAGLIPESTGYQNIEMLLKLYGEYTPHKVQRIIEFSELGDFIYAPVKIYSQGMYLRLTFSVAINTDPDVLLVDDILAVGDAHFQKKCLNRIKDIIAQGKTLLIVTHNFDLACSLCSRGVVMEKGEIVADGSIHEMRPFFDSITGNLCGVGILKNEKICFIFNNGRGSIIFNNRVITADLGMFVMYLQEGKSLYSTDLQWQVQEKINTLIAEGKFGNKIIAKYKFIIEGNYLKLSTEAISPKVLFNLMLQESYSQIKYLEQSKKLPSISDDSKREWENVLRMVCDNITIIPSRNFPPLSLFFQQTEVIMYNYNFHNKSRIFQMNQENSNFSLVIKFWEENPEVIPPIVLRNPFQNLFCSQDEKQISTIFHEIHFISYQNDDLYTNLRQETIKSSDLSEITEIIKLGKADYNVFFIYNLQDNGVIFKIFANQEEIYDIQGLDFHIIDYKIYYDRFGERLIPEGEFQNIGFTTEFYLRSFKDEIPGIHISLIPGVTLLIKNETDFIILRFLFKITLQEQIFKFNYEKDSS